MSTLRAPRPSEKKFQEIYLLIPSLIVCLWGGFTMTQQAIEFIKKMKDKLTELEDLLRKEQPNG